VTANWILSRVLINALTCIPAAQLSIDGFFGNNSHSRMNLGKGLVRGEMLSNDVEEGRPCVVLRPYMKSEVNDLRLVPLEALGRHARNLAVLRTASVRSRSISDSDTSLFVSCPRFTNASIITSEAILIVSSWLLAASFAALANIPCCSFAFLINDTSSLPPQLCGLRYEPMIARAGGSSIALFMHWVGSCKQGGLITRFTFWGRRGDRPMAYLPYLGGPATRDGNERNPYKTDL
jgi:hypothetical protein